MLMSSEERVHALTLVGARPNSSHPAGIYRSSGKSTRKNQAAKAAPTNWTAISARMRGATLARKRVYVMKVLVPSSPSKIAEKRPSSEEASETAGFMVGLKSPNVPERPRTATAMARPK